MKIRTGFVSNSSSSSFVIPLNAITAEQRQKIYNHIEEGKKLGMDNCDDYSSWSIQEEETLTLTTFMDNFNMHSFLDAIGVDMDKVEQREY
jgi:hypothetical protein